MMKKRILVVLMAMAALGTAAQTVMTMTNTLFYTNRWTSVTARVQSQPQTTNDPWTIHFVMSGSTSPGWALTTNNATISYGASAYALVSVTNSEIASLTGIPLTNILAAPYFGASTNAMNAALQKLIQSTIGR